MTDHDRFFKSLVHEALPDFLGAFLPKWAERLDFSSVEWIDKELFLDPPDGARRFPDAVAKVRLRQAAGAPWTELLCLIHFEFEGSDSLAEMRLRMFEYYRLLRRLGLPVLPIVVFLNTALNGLGVETYEETFFDLTALRFEFLYIALPGLDAETYVKTSNPAAAAVSGLMRHPEHGAAKLRADAAKAIAEGLADGSARRLMFSMVETYWTLGEDETVEYDRLTRTKAYEEVRKMAVTTYEKGVEKGIEKGIEKGRRRLLTEQLEDRFGELPASARDRIEAMAGDELRDLAKRLLRAASLKELGLAD